MNISRFVADVLGTDDIGLFAALLDGVTWTLLTGASETKTPMISIVISYNGIRSSIEGEYWMEIFDKRFYLSCNRLPLIFSEFHQMLQS